VLASALFPLTMTRFIVYEETLAYFVLCQLLAISAYMFAGRSPRAGVAVAIGVATGLSMLVRPTGIPYAAMWCVLVAVEWRGRKLFALLAGLAPFVALWLWTNVVRTGSWLGLGFTNSTPAWPYNMPIERFGSRCADTLPHALLGAARLFTGFFLFVTHRASVPWLADCHFDFEDRGGVLPFFGPVVLALVVWLVRGLAVRRERSLSVWAPFALMAVLFAAFVHRGMGFAWRYAADFWPALVVACIQAVEADVPWPIALDARTRAKVLLGYGALMYLVFFLPWRWGPETLPPAATEAMAARFEASMGGTDPPVPSRVACGDRLAPIFQNGLGWGPDCGVDTFTNLYLGVPPRPEQAQPRGSYRLRAKTERIDAPALRIYVNGNDYVSRRVDDGYEADVAIPYRSLGSPIVVVTVQWTRGFEPPPGAKLASIELD
jgi:hypothetical protein